MNQTTYERPREKLRSRGINFLTNVELIQVILGSGTATISAAKLAKKVAAQVVADPLSYDTLLAIKGIGHARACQLLASVELGRRITSKRPNIIQIHVDEAGKEMDRKFYDVVKGESGGVLARRVFADVVSVGARSLCIVVSRGKRPLIPTSADLTLLKALKEASVLLQVRINFIHAVNAYSVKDWSSEV